MRTWWPAERTAGAIEASSARAGASARPYSISMTVTVLTAMASILTGRPVRDDVAMTGEITLRGRVLPIGGIKEKVLGAHRAGLRRVLMPAHNVADLDDIPADLRKQMQFVMIESIDQVLREALVPGKPAVLNGGNGVRTTVLARPEGSSRGRQAPPSRRGAKGRRRPVGGLTVG